MKYSLYPSVLVFIAISLMLSCRSKDPSPSREIIALMNLKKGDIISCGPADKQFGKVNFEMSCGESVQKDFNLAVALLHSFEYDESEKAFAKVIDESPNCAMAYWGVAMCNFHALWSPPSELELQKGARAIEIAHSIKEKSARESGFIDAIGLFYKDWDKTDHHSRCLQFEKAMESLHASYPEDKEASLFYVLALDAAADPKDKTYANQKKAGTILQALYALQPDHPGIIHYIIHTYDYPGLASLGLTAARNYAAVAPSSAHALHMPSHIFTRLGLWDESIQSNLKSVDAAKCYASSAGIKGHWDEELHGLDYLVYAYLQKGDNSRAEEQLNYLKTIQEVYPVDFKEAYAFAAIPSRFLLENKKWKEAAALDIHPSSFPWNKFPWEEAIFHFTRLMGAAHLSNAELAGKELILLQGLYDTLQKQKNIYQAQQVAVQLKAGQAWMDLASGKKEEALALMKAAADLEDGTEKHPVTPGEVLPARELLGDMLLEMKKYEAALQSYESALIKSPNRFNSLYGAGLSAEKSGDKEKAISYYRQLLTITNGVNSNRPELVYIRAYLKKYA